METEFDYIILGTGITECALCWALSNKNKKVLQLDSNKTYGSDLRTLSYKETQEHFNKEIDMMLLDSNRDFNIDLMPKLIVADGEVKSFLEKQSLFDVLEFTTITGSFIYKSGKTHNIPTSYSEALTSGVIGFFDKKNVMKFFWDVKNYLKLTDEKKIKEKLPKTMREYFGRYGLKKESMEFIGHAIALNLDDDYLDRRPEETIEKIGLFVRSVMVFENNLKSPYIYTVYGTSELSQIFSRRAAICGAVFRLDTPVRKIEFKDKKIEVEIDDKIENKVVVLSCKNIVGEPFYFRELTKTVNRVIHCTCIVKGDVPIIKGCSSAQVIFLASEFKRKNDIFLLILGDKEKAAPEGYKIGMISTVMETNDAEYEIKRVTEKLGNIVEKHVKIRDVMWPLETPNNVFITKTVDQSTHFESVFKEMVEMAKKLECADIFL